MEAYPISFDNTQAAFAYKSDKELKKARFLFSSMRISWLVKWGTRLTPWAIRTGLPIMGLIRNTIFDQFVGGETLEETAAVADKLEKFEVQVILDYGVEGNEGEDSFDHSYKEFIRVIKYAATQPNMPFISIKVTGFARFTLLEKLDKAMREQAAPASSSETVVPEKQVVLAQVFRAQIEQLAPEEKEEWKRVEERMDKIISFAASTKVSVLVDAEETWIQDPVDAITMKMMERYNKERPVVYNTIQLYREDRLKFLKESLKEADHQSFILGAKLVRGAYMEKERARAAELNYSSPIQPDKASTDRDYNEAVKFCINNIDRIALIVASHNEHSNLYATQLMHEKGIDNNNPSVHFSQLYGMSDNITFNLAASGYRVSKYLPFGPIKDVIPYLMRRAQENSSVSGHTGRELRLIKKEIQRRKSLRHH